MAPSSASFSKTVNGVTTFYTRDAQGSVMGIYENTGTAYNWKEQDIYGSSRLGMLTPKISITGTGISALFNNTINDHAEDAGNRLYDLTNHLGNVMVTVSDIKLNPSAGIYLPSIVSSQDYYSFGSAMPGRQSGTPGRYEFNGQEHSDEIGDDSYTAQFWEYDARIGRRWNIDPVVKMWQSGYATFSDNPVINVDPNGDDDYFNSRGEFLKRQGSGTEIRIEGLPGTTKLTDIDFKHCKSFFERLQKIALASNILTYYGKQVQVQGTVLVSVEDASDGNTEGQQVNLSVNSVTGKVRLNDYNSISNVLRHEKGHQDLNSEKAKKNQQDIPITFAEHTQIYIQQFQHNSFGNISADERVGRVSSAVNYALNSVLKEKDSDFRNSNTGVYDIIEDLNKAVSKYHIEIKLNDNSDAKKGFKIIDRKGTRSYQYEDKKDAH